MYYRNFLGGPVARTLGSQCRGPGFNPCQGTRSYVPQLRVHIPQLKIPACAPQLKPVCVCVCVCVFVCVCVCVCVFTQSCLTLCDPQTVAHQAPLPIEFSRQEFWSGLPFPSPGDLPNPRIKPESLMSPSLAGRFFTTGPPGKPN